MHMDIVLILIQTPVPIVKCAQDSTISTSRQLKLKHFQPQLHTMLGYITGRVCLFLIFLNFFYEYFSFSLTWDPMGAKISNTTPIVRGLDRPSCTPGTGYLFWITFWIHPQIHIFVICRELKNTQFS